MAKLIQFLENKTPNDSQNYLTDIIENDEKFVITYSATLEQENGQLSNVKVDEVLALVRNV